jgi:NitT/TauT family transport system ATP-binding protein
VKTLETRKLVKDFRTRAGTIRALDGIDLYVDIGELVCLVGASGCGKSTLLSIVAGLIQPTSGTVLLDGQRIRGPGPDRGLVFQSYSLYPWRTVAGNIAFGLELKGMHRAEINRRVTHLLHIVGMTRFANALPRELSGGMQQRAAVARALATEPEVLLLDEPFGALDAQTRSSMRQFLLDLWRDTGTTILMVTHDVEEAVLCAQRIYVLSPHPGRVVEEILVPFGRNRTRQLLREPAFHDVCERLDDLLHTAPTDIAD